MRKSKEEAIQTRKRIVATAASEFRKKGVVASGLNELMNESGLTRGGFYKHFESKDQLVAEACAEALADSAAKLSAFASQGGAKAIGAYLSSTHRDNPGAGCPLAAIGSELARCDERTREVVTEGFRELVTLVSRQFGDLPAAQAKRRAMVGVSTMIGALTMSRIVNDPNLSSAILKEAQKSLSQR